MSLTTFVASSRIVRGATASLAFQGVDADGEPANPGTVTVEVRRSDGTVLKAAGTATVGSGTAVRTVALTAADTSVLDVLTAIWSVGSTVVGETAAEIVGGVYATVDEIRAIEPALSSATEYPSDRVVLARRQVEQMFEDACNRAFVPRFRVDQLSGDSEMLVVRRPDVRAIRWCEVFEDDEFVSIDVAGLRVTELGAVLNPDGWPQGHLNVRIGYEYGLDRPPEDLKKASVQAIRAQLNTFASGIPDRATSLQPFDGGNIVLATPGLGPWITGIPAVDEALKRYKWRDAVIA